MSREFRFRHFTVMQEKSAFKVGTDSVLLGAWADVANAASILDIGTGTGILALMCAQRNTSAWIKAIDIDEASVLEAKENFSHEVLLSYQLPVYPTGKKVVRTPRYRH